MTKRTVTLMAIAIMSTTSWAQTPVERVETEQQVVALTFDDGPNPVNAPKLLELFKKHGVKATFFVIGKNVRKHPELAKRMLAEGHELGNHTTTHANLAKLGDLEKVKKEIEETQEILKDTVGKPAAVFRAPFLAHDKNVWTVLKDMPSINASRDTSDWSKDSTTQSIIEKATKHTKAGDIVLMHSWPNKTIEAMPKIIKALQAKGLKLVTVSELLAAAEKPVEGPIGVFLGKPLMEVQPLFKAIRHPNIVVTVKGTVLATLGDKKLLARRSEDGGKTWGQEIIVAEPAFQGGGLTVDETTGDILAFAEDKHPPAPLSVYRSRDDGKTWRKMAVKIHPDTRGNVPSMHMNEHGITLRHGKHAGRLIRAARHYGEANYPKKHWPTHYTTAIYSDDHGKTWKTSKPFAEMGTGEAAIAELSDGTLYYNSRSHWNAKKPPLRRRCARSADGGATWTGWKIVEILPDGPQNTNYGCFAGLVRLPIAGRDILLYSNCDSPAGRKRGTVWVSFDGGKTWPLKRLVWKDTFQYSALSAGRPGTTSEGWIYMHFEGRLPQTRVARFNLSWLMAGEPTGDGEVPKIEIGSKKNDGK
jgi:sialidase-1